MDIPPASGPGSFGEPWQDILTSHAPPPGDEADTSAAEPSKRRGVVRAAGIVLGGLLVGAVAVSISQAGSHGSAPPATAAASENVAPDGQAAPQDQLGRPPLGGAGGPAFGGGPGGLDGEQRLTGTLTAVGASSVTVRTAGGTSTYHVDSATDIQRDGRTVELSALKAGDAVLVHVFPAGSGYTAERILAGSSSSTGPGAATPQPTAEGQQT